MDRYNQRLIEIDNDVSHLMTEYKKWKKYKIFKPLFIYSLIISHLIMALEISDSFIISLLAITGFYTIIYILFKEKLKKMNF